MFIQISSVPWKARVAEAVQRAAGENNGDLLRLMSAGAQLLDQVQLVTKLMPPDFQCIFYISWMIYSINGYWIESNLLIDHIFLYYIPV